ncbi:MAG: hypothetical protein WBO37_07860, partial [Gammaproteobacteria bacterium]
SRLARHLLIYQGEQRRKEQGGEVVPTTQEQELSAQQLQEPACAVVSVPAVQEQQIRYPYRAMFDGGPGHRIILCAFQSS